MIDVITALGTMAAIIGAGWLLGHRGTLGTGGRRFWRESASL